MVIFKCLDKIPQSVHMTLQMILRGRNEKPLWELLREAGLSCGCSVSQVQDERTKEEDRALACSPVPITAERRRSLWYATHYPTDERKVSLGGRGFSSFAAFV